MVRKIFYDTFSFLPSLLKVRSSLSKNRLTFFLKKSTVIDFSSKAYSQLTPVNWLFFHAAIEDGFSIPIP
jgi:hypothetical protein